MHSAMTCIFIHLYHFMVLNGIIGDQG